MTPRFPSLRTLPRPEEAHVVWVELDEEGVHFLDAVFGAWDDLANVRREYKPEGGRKLFKIFVAPGCLDEALGVLRRAGKFVRVGEIRVER